MNDARWKSNLEAFEQRSPKLAQVMKSVPLDPTRVVVGQAANRAPILGVHMGQSAPVALDHTQSPMENAKQWVASLNKEMLLGGNLLLVGAGTGYHALALQEAVDYRTQLWIVEPEPVILRTAMQCLDLRPLFDSERVRWIIGKPALDTAQQLTSGKEGFRTRAQGINVAIPPFAKVLYAQFIQQLQTSIQEEIHKEGLRFRTWEEHIHTSFENISGNIPAILKSTPLYHLQSLASGVPALVIAPGPSLEEAIPLIREAVGHAVIIAVDTAHRILLRHGIHAHLVVSVDFTELNIKHFEDVDDPDTLLVTYSGVQPQIPARYEGRVFFFDLSTSAEDMDSTSNLSFGIPSMQRIGRLLAYGSTAHAAYSLARYLACGPIYLIGNDLGFPGERYYASGAMQESLDMSERKSEKRMVVLANDGEEIPTSGLYLTYLEHFGELIRATGGHVYNLSYHGAKIDAAPYCSLDEAREWILRGRFDPQRLKTVTGQPMPGLAERACIDMKQLVEQCENAYKGIRRLQKKIDALRPLSPEYHAQYLVCLKEVQVLAGQDRYAMLLAFHLSPRAHHTLFSKMDDVVPGSSPEQNQVSMERLVDFASAIREALKNLRGWISEALVAIDRDG